MDRFTSEDMPATTRAPISEALGFANAAVFATIFWTVVAFGAWCAFG
ncbi:MULTISPECIES: hypothetical protein [unclassified Aureimonas]|nr:MULTISPECIES: hypothetical protein [unclassified Aureimonas]